MANEKISELPSGSPAQPGDEIPIARGGSNFSLAASDIAQLASTIVGGGGIAASIGGNTAGAAALVSNGTLFLAGGNNVTLSQIGNSVTISANTAAAATLSVSAGGSSGAFGGVTFNPANGVSFGLNNGTITASVSPGLNVGQTNLGNSAGQTGTFANEFIFVGGNNVTLSQQSGPGGATMSINAQGQSVQTQASGNIGATGFVTTTGAGSQIAGTHNTAGFTLAVPPFLTTAAGGGGGIDVTLGGNTAGVLALVSTGTMFLAGGNNITLSQNGNSVTISANTAAAANLSVSAGSTTGAFGGLTFSNGSNVSFGLNNGTITASVLAQSVQTQASGNIAGTGVTTTTQGGSTLGVTHNTAGLSLAVPAWITAGAGANSATGFALGNTTQASSGTIALSAFNVSAAGIVSAGVSAGTLFISSPASTGITQSLFAASNTTQGTSGTQSIGSLVLAGAGNVSVGVSNGSYVISGAGGAGGGGVNFGVSTGGNTAGATGTVSTGNVVLVGSGPISLSQATAAAGSAATITINAPAISSISGTGQLSVAIAGSTISLGVPTQSAFFAGNTTNSSSGTFTNGSLGFSGAGNVTVGYSAGSVIISATGGGVGGIALSAAGSSQSGGTVAFSNSNSVSFGMNGSTVTASFSASQQTIGLFAVGNTTQVSSVSRSLSAVSVSGQGGVSVGYSNSVLGISGPGISSISATGLASVSVNGSTISIGVPGSLESVWKPPYWGQQTPNQIGNGTVQVFPAIVDGPFTASRADMFVSLSASLIPLTSYAGTLSAYIGIYTRNASTLSLASSGSQTYSFSNSNNNNTTAFVGYRNVSVPINVNGAPGDAWIAVMTQTASAGTNGWTGSNMVFAGAASPIAGLIGSSNAASQQPMLGLGIFSVSSAALPSSMAFSAIVGSNSAGTLVPSVAFHNVTA